MSKTYKAIGINLKSMPLGEADRLLTILTREYGLVRAVAMGARKTNSKLGGRSSLFVVNELLIAKGRSLDKITQAETLESYPRLGQDLKRLTASQYLAELVLCQALSEQPQEELFVVLNQYLKRLEQGEIAFILPSLIQAICHLFALAGVAPQLDYCTLTRHPIHPDQADPSWRVGFSFSGGGVATLAALEEQQQKKQSQTVKAAMLAQDNPAIAAPARQKRQAPSYRLMTATELALLQLITQAKLNQEDSSIPELPDLSVLSAPTTVWLAIERILRQYAQYHFDQSIRSATLMDACFAPN
jgi:DNA repair protein RecO (recombination protein O)